MWRVSNKTCGPRSLQSRDPAAFMALLIAGSAAYAGTPDNLPVYQLNIASQPLDDALQEFARQSGIQLVFFSRIAQGQEAAALTGEYTTHAALTALLADSKLTFRELGANTFEIRRADPRSRAHFKLANPQEPMEEIVVRATAKELVATRIETPLREIPQSISIVSRERMRQQNDVDLGAVLGHAPGMTVVRTNSLDQDSNSRAYPVTSFHTDGGAAINPSIDGYDFFYSAPDMSEFDHVEVLRGSDALSGGNGNPGGTVSMVRKRPLDRFALDLSAFSGSWDNRRIEMDLTGPIALDGALRARTVAVFADRDFFYDTATFQRKKIFAALEYDVTPDATLNVGGSFQKDDAVPLMGGVPLYSGNADEQVPRSIALAFDWARYRTRVSEAYVQYQQDFARNWAVKINAATWRANVEHAFGVFIIPHTNGTQSSARAANDRYTRVPNVHNWNTVDVTFSGETEWFGLRQQFAFGGDFTRFRARLDQATTGFFGPLLQDPRSFDPRDYPDPRSSAPMSAGVALHSILDQYGVFASFRTQLGSDWSVTGGARVGSDALDAKLLVDIPPLPTLALETAYGSHHVLTPFAGLMYDIEDHYTAYLSYADIYRTNSAVRRRVNGELIEPISGVTLESGIKAEWREGALNGRLAAYRTRQGNLPFPELREYPATNDPNCCFVAVENRSWGVDLELDGELRAGWLIGAGYTFNVNEGETGGALSTATPRHLLKIWTSARLPGVFNRWTAGGNLQAQSAATSLDLNCQPRGPLCQGRRIEQDPYAVLDLRLGFQLDANWQVALSANNVFDEIYFESLGSAGAGADALRPWYGEPRNFLLKVDGKF